MTEETSESTEPETITSEAPPKPNPPDPPKVVKEAEHKLKEMSRKAKERKAAHYASKHPKGLSEINYFWLVIGGLGALGVGYLVFGRKEQEPKPRQRFKFVPKPKTPVKERHRIAAPSAPEATRPLKKKTALARGTGSRSLSLN